MTPADASHPGSRTADGTDSSRRTARLWIGLLAIPLGVLAILALLPDGVAEPAQAVLAWLLAGAVAVGAVAAIVTGLERLLDCESGQ
jgi:peptidoglycan/LPS O-acetylase OafA/YrhL